MVRRRLITSAALRWFMSVVYRTTATSSTSIDGGVPAFLVLGDPQDHLENLGHHLLHCFPQKESARYPGLWGTSANQGVSPYETRTLTQNFLRDLP